MIDKTFPLVELHRHLDGNMRLETVLELGLHYGLPLPAADLQSLRPFVQVTEPKPSLMAFLEKFHWPIAILKDMDAVRRIAYENMEDAAREGIAYIELRFSPWFMAEANHLDPAGVVEAVVDGVQAGERDFGVKANLIGILSRTYGVDIAWKELDALLTQKDHLVALDLAGDESNYPAQLFTGHFAKGRDAGWQVTVHAGEVMGPESVWSALHHLKAERIGHATRSFEDPALIDYLLEHHIGVEVSLTSNVQTSVVTDYAAHPLRQFLERGVLATLNTDDPGISGIDLHHEYETAAPAAGLSPEMIRQAQRNALETAFLSPNEKQSLLNHRK
ncbi:MAG: adenosine deaminase [Anaerolineaceae bacterium]|jgi:adenosine deaminase|nr:adenosine deaminase [Anaerolineaceae bacterium]